MRVLTLPGVAVDRAVEAVTLVWRRAGSAWGDEAVEGVALGCKRCFPQAVAASGGYRRKPDGLLLKGSRIGSQPPSAMRSYLPQTEHACLCPNRTHEKFNWSPVTPTCLKDKALRQACRRVLSLHCRGCSSFSWLTPRSRRPGARSSHGRLVTGHEPRIRFACPGPAGAGPRYSRPSGVGSHPSPTSSSMFVAHS